MSSAKYSVRRTPPDLVWLRDSQCQVALQPEEWRGEPRPGELAFYAPHFYRHDSPKPWLCGTPVAWPIDEFDTLPAFRKVSDPDVDHFAAIHAEILSGISDQRFQKVVPFVSQDLEFCEPLQWTMFPSAFADSVAQFGFGFQFGLEGMAGITPELLFQVENGLLVTGALAGTGRSDAPSLLHDSKEILEHDFVTDHIVSSLDGLGDLSVGSTREVCFGHIKHLFTPIAVKLDDVPQFSDLVYRMHPTAALGGLPRSAAMDFLRLRGGERRRFGAPFGYVHGDKMLCVVAIRALQWNGLHAWLMSGCGVVKGSVADREWAELALKRQTAGRQLGLEL